MITKIFGSALWKRVQGVCSGTSETYASFALSGHELYKLPPEHRVKPKPLDITPRAVQFAVQAKCRVTKREAVTSWLYCGGAWHSVTTTEWFRFVPFNVTQDLGSLNYGDHWILALRQKIQDDKVSFAETLGEWREGVKLLGSAVKTISRAGKLAKNLLKKRGRRRALTRWYRAQFGVGPDSKLALQDAITMDLVIKFGIQPNVNLLWDTIAALGRVTSRHRRLQITVRSGAEKSYPSNLGGAYFLHGERSDRLIAFVVYDLNDSLFTAGNLAEALWAGVPLSFVLDWFYDVGSYLNSFNGMKGVSSFKAARCIRTKVLITDDRRAVYSNETVEKPGQYTYNGYERKVLTTLPFADPPAFKLPDSDLWGRLHTLIEMLSVQRTSRRF